MDKMTAETTLALEIFERMLDSLEGRLTSFDLKKTLHYNESEFNRSAASDFGQIKEVLQTTVDKFFHSYYDVSGYEYMTAENVEETSKANLALLASARKLMRFMA